MGFTVHLYALFTLQQYKKPWACMLVIFSDRHILQNQSKNVTGLNWISTACSPGTVRSTPALLTLHCDSWVNGHSVHLSSSHLSYTDPSIFPGPAQSLPQPWAQRPVNCPGRRPQPLCNQWQTLSFGLSDGHRSFL